MENSFKQLVDSAESVLILLPKGPFFDQVAAGLALYLGIKEKKPVSISCPSDMTVEFSRLIGVDKVSSELGGNNLVIKFRDYNAQNIERVTYDIENKEFRLTVIPKPGAIPPEEGQVKVSYAGASASLVILIGGANDSHFPALDENDLVGSKFAHIGTQDISSKSAKKIMSFARTSSSVSELAAGYIKDLGVSINGDMATNILAGIKENSKNFTSSYVSADTFKLAGELVDAGAKQFDVERPRREYTSRDFGVTAKQEEKQVEAPKEEIKEEVKEEAAESSEEEAPKSWLEPKIYKGSQAN